MTEFMYENQEVLEELSKQYFDKGDLPIVDSVDQLSVCKYLLCYRYIKGAKISQTAVATLKAEALRLEYTKQNLIFFEKFNTARQDFLYFEEYMKNAEKNNCFLSTWQTWFKIA